MDGASIPHYDDLDLPNAENVVVVNPVENGHSSEPDAVPEQEHAECDPDDPFDDEEFEEPMFVPPLYIQRYCFVEDLIESYSQTTELESLVDIGCAELKFLQRARNAKDFQRLVGIDMDEFLLGGHVRKLQPALFDMINLREKPLKIEIYTGDATLPDQRLVNVDVVSAIELIEHMEPETHNALVTNVFDVMQPKLAVFTTPNVEYNPLFPNGSVDQRRHWDHRFEWTRAQFRNWANSVTERYPVYTVRYDGVGEGPEGTLSTHGHCSQIAVFTRDLTVPCTKRAVTTHAYKTVREIKFPWAPPKTLYQKVSDLVDAECYTLAQEMQEAAELERRYNQEWFRFSLESLYSTRWRLQNLLQPPDHLDMLRKAVMEKQMEWLKFCPEKDEISYKISLGNSDKDSSDDDGVIVQVDENAVQEAAAITWD